MSSCVTYPLLGKNGRLGNQLFQIAATLGYANKHGKSFTFPDWEYSCYFKNSYCALEMPKEYKTIRELGFEYSEIPFMDGNVGLEGYFQSEKYFKESDWLVKNRFEFTDDVREKAQAIVDTPYENQRTVAIHFRFGDYVGNSFYSQIWETGYYEKALWEIYRTVSPFEIQAKYFIFSDDINRAIEVMASISAPPIFGDLTYIYGHKDIVDLAAMSYCDKIIMANSSFSWWAAYLNKKKQVIAPGSWFSESAGLNTKDLYCEGWKIL